MIKEEDIKKWKENVYDKEQEIDPDQEQDWRSMAIGFALGCGYSTEEAYIFANTLDSKRLL